MYKDVYAHIEDKELLDRYLAENDNKWIGILLQRYTMLLLGVCMKYLRNEEEAKDAVQQIFLKVITEVPKYKITFFKSWLYMVAKNVCLMRLRKRQEHIPIELTDQLIQPDDAPSKEAYREKENTHTYIEEALEELNAEQKVCVSLFYLKKQSYQQITVTTGFTLLQVKSFIQNGKRNLKMLVEKKMKQ